MKGGMKNEKRKYHSNYYNNSFDFNSFVSKSSGDSSNVENSEFYGVNAGILVTSGSQATNSTLSTAGRKNKQNLYKMHHMN